MEIRIKDLPQDGMKMYEGDEDPSILALDPEDRLAKAEQPVRYRLSACLVTGQLIVRGQVWTEVCFRCSRCTEEFRLAVRDDAFERVLDLPADTPSVDLTEDIREAILLNFSAYPVCRTDCQGLCARCGANLNRETCRCQPSDDGRWAGLDRLRLPGGPGRR